MPDRNAAAQRAQAFLQMIKACGYIPVILGMDPDLQNDNILKTKQEYKGAIIFSNCYPNNSTAWLRTLFDIGGIVDVMNYLGYDNIKAVICMDYFSPALAGIMRLCKKKQIRFVADTVDWFEKSQYSFPKRLIKDIDTWMRMKLIYKHTSHMITISKYLYYYYKNNVSNLIEIPGVFAPLEEECKGNARYKGNELLRFVFVGSPGKRCEKEKIDWIIKIVCELNEKKKCCEFVIAGIDKTTLKEYRPDLTDLNTFDESIKCLGRVSHEACIKLLIESDFSVIVREDTLLSRAGFPTKIGESFSCGTPVFATPTGNIIDYIPKEYGYITKECTYESVKQGIEKIRKLSKEEITHMHQQTKMFNPLDCRLFLEKLNCILK